MSKAHLCFKTSIILLANIRNGNKKQINISPSTLAPLIANGIRKITKIIENVFVFSIDLDPNVIKYTTRPITMINNNNILLGVLKMKL